MKLVNNPTFAPDFGGEPISKPARHHWRDQVWAAASPELCRLIEAARDAETAYKNERLAGAAMREAFPTSVAPSDEEIQAARSGVEVPEILREPVLTKQVVALSFSDGSSVSLSPPRDYRVLSAEEIADRFADDVERREEANAALRAYEEAVRRAVKAAFAAKRSPEYERAYKAHAKWERNVLSPKYDTWQAAKKALEAYRPAPAADRLLQVTELFTIAGGKIDRNGWVSDAENGFEGPDGDRLAQLVFNALRAMLNSDRASLDGFDAGAWIDGFERLPGHFVDGRGPTYIEPEAWPDGDHSKSPPGSALWRALSSEQKAAVQVEGARRRPMVMPDMKKMVGRRVPRGSGPAILAAE